MFKKILIADRGEIAVRIIRACREMSIRTVAVYSEIDKEAFHVRLADESVCIGPAEIKKSYMNMNAIISAALVAKVDAVHPGSGLLAENDQFAKLCKKSGLTFIGCYLAEPSYRFLDRIKIKTMVDKMGIQVVNGSRKTFFRLEEGLKIAEEIGYPVILKPWVNPDGKVKIIYEDKDFKTRFWELQKESMLKCNNKFMFLESFIENAKHIEIQLIADNYGNVVCLYESIHIIQNNYKSMLEESPYYNLSDTRRNEIWDMIVKVARAIDFTGIGTVKLLLKEDGLYYFLSLNRRVGEDHLISEMVSEIDLIKEQIRIAAGEKLSFSQHDIRFAGTAISCSIKIENSGRRQVSKQDGKVSLLHIPNGNNIRVDTNLYYSYRIKPEYDSLLAKLVCRGKTREEAINKLRNALGEFIIEGVNTNIDDLCESIDLKYLDSL